MTYSKKSLCSICGFVTNSVQEGICGYRCLNCGGRKRE